MQRSLTNLDKTITSTVTMSCSFSTTFYLQILWCTHNSMSSLSAILLTLLLPLSLLPFYVHYTLQDNQC